MPRSRKRTAQDKPAPSTTDTTNDNSTSTTKENKIMSNVLDSATIAQLLASQKSRGDYDAELNEFLKSGVPGIEVSLTEGRFTGKTAQNVKTGLNNAKGRVNKETNKPIHEGGNLVKVISVEDDENVEHVYLINTAAASGEGAEDES